jgi:opacity protein-like surface antigen
MIGRTALAILLICACLAGASAAGGLHYVNVWYRYAIDLPPGFSAIDESGNGDGGLSYSPDRKSKLAVWGTNALTESFSSDVEGDIQSDQDKGWEIGYRKVAGRWASWSGEKDGRIFYARRIVVCGEGIAAFQLEYPGAAKDAFDPVVQNLVNSLKATSCD